jgi:hypothetical protein
MLGGEGDEEHESSSVKWDPYINRLVRLSTLLHIAYSLCYDEADREVGRRSHSPLNDLAKGVVYNVRHGTISAINVTILDRFILEKLVVF